MQPNRRWSQGMSIRDEIHCQKHTIPSLVSCPHTREAKAGKKKKRDEDRFEWCCLPLTTHMYAPFKTQHISSAFCVRVSDGMWLNFLCGPTATVAQLKFWICSSVVRLLLIAENVACSKNFEMLRLTWKDTQSIIASSFTQRCARQSYCSRWEQDRNELS